MSPNLEDRVALVTGGSGQLGRHVVERLLREGIPVHVPIFHDDESEALRRFLGTRATHLKLHPDGDLTNPDRVAAIVSAVRAEAGRGPDILVNLAGGFAMHPLADTDPSTWDRMWRMNASTVFLCSRAVFPLMSKEGWGRIVNVSAFPAIERGKPSLSAYGAAKAAVLNLTQTLAKEGVETGITVNAILPSIIDTPANREAMPDADTTSWLPPSSIAEVVAFLVSDSARIVNGAAIPLTLG